MPLRIWCSEGRNYEALRARDYIEVNVGDSFVGSSFHYQDGSCTFEQSPTVTESFFLDKNTRQFSSTYVST